VSPFFENLPSRTENSDYYKQIRLPLSLGIIERKLKDKEYPNLSSVESDFKRLVSNAKETNDRSSTIFGDAERVRKAVSNLMVKHNPAYKSGNYQAVPTPLPPSPGPGEEEANGDDHADESAGDQTPKDREATSTPHNYIDEAEAEEKEDKEITEDEQEEEGQQSEEENDEDEEDEDNEDEQEDGDDEEADSHPRRRRVSTTRRSEPGQSRDSTTPARRTAQRPGKSDHHYENTTFTGLSFQEAQEKVVEELIRYKEDS
jgi:hypothetical protein